MIPMLGRRPVLDGIRGVAVLLVIARHAMPSAFGGAGMVGVGLFFVLSGFLITTLLMEEKDANGRISLTNFYLRRALRLLPALIAMLAIVAVVGSFATYGTDRHNLLASIGFSATYLTGYAAFFDYPIFAGLGPMWSLAVEEQFYLFWPLVLVLVFRLARPVRTAAIVAATALSISLAIRIGSFLLWGPDIYELPSTWSDGLLMGCILALAWKSGRIKVERLPSIVGWMGWILIGLIALWPSMKDSSLTYTIGLTVLFGIAGCVLLTSMQPQNSIIKTALSVKPLLWVGRRSYAIYLWNFILISLVPDNAPWRQGWILLAVLSTFLVAEMSWRCVEQPAIRLKKRYETDRTHLKKTQDIP